jgi:uncharacterized iron-regulated protein
MKKRSIVAVAVVLLSALCLLPVLSARESGKVYRLSDSSLIDKRELIAEVRKTRIIVVGEIHDSEAHHHLQLSLLKALHDAGVPIAVAFEMFPRDGQATLDRWVSGRLPEDDLVQFYEEFWRFPWSLYRDILLFVRDNRIPALGLNIPQSISRKVVESGFSSLTSEELRQLPPSLTCNVTGEYRDFIRRVYSYHAHEGQEFTNFCEAQLLWDKAMAWYLVDYVKQHPRRTVVVLTGLTHAWKPGIPDRIREFSASSPFAVLLPQVPDAVEPGDLSADDADYIVPYGTFFN